MSENATITGTMSPEEIRVEMKRRFDAANAASEKSRHASIDHALALQAADEQLTSEQAPGASDDSPEVGENDALGG